MGRGRKRSGFRVPWPKSRIGRIAASVGLVLAGLAILGATMGGQ